MPQHARPARLICHNCDGFGRAVTTGHRHDGTRTTTPVNCPTCHGRGTVARAFLPVL
ncbi:hypothetical protein [Kitasatospora phosalacinea]|uniref:hypothetical protein n=1 Tax=Kitasatospora phosalacinea TaxID=2065 RepID=UPI000A6C80EC|nr:hypothetical protein [Kitasatospora phosalacinea]